MKYKCSLRVISEGKNGGGVLGHWVSEDGINHIPHILQGLLTWVPISERTGAIILKPRVISRWGWAGGMLSQERACSASVTQVNQKPGFAVFAEEVEIKGSLVFAGQPNQSVNHWW